MDPIYNRRIENAQKELKSRGWGGLALFLGPNCLYFTGLDKNPSERLLTTVIPAEGKPFMVSPAFEVELVKKKTKAQIDDVLPWEEHESPYTTFEKGLSSRGISNSTLAFDGQFEYRFVYQINKAASNIKLELGEDLISKLRLAKSSEELEYMRKACTGITKGMKASHESIAAGRTELECSLPLHEEIKKNGGSSRGSGGLTSGTVSSLPHGTSSDKKIENGDMILIDTGATVNGYYGDLTRMAVLGEPSDKMKKVYKIVLDAQAAAIAKSAPGAPCQDLDNAARSFITNAGYGEYFTHRVGHGLGLEVHEEPFLVKGNTKTLTPGNVHSVEPGIYLPGEFGIRIEDQVAVTETGHDVLSAGLFSTDELTVL